MNLATMFFSAVVGAIDTPAVICISNGPLERFFNVIGGREALQACAMFACALRPDWTITLMDPSSGTHWYWTVPSSAMTIDKEALRRAPRRRIA